MTLHLHRAERADRLADALAELLADPLDDPFAAEVVSVPTRGVERWLAQRLSHRLGAGEGGRDGVCARIDFPSLPTLLTRANRELGGAAADWKDPWAPDRLVWPLLRVVDASRGQPWAELIWAHLADPGRRFGFARHLAELFSAYGRSRPTMVRSWGAGADVDAGGHVLSADRVWQAELWRRLRAEVGEPSSAERLDGLPPAPIEASVVELPPRLSVFGLSRLDAEQLRWLDALAGSRDVHLWLPHPSPGLWAEVGRRLRERSAAGAGQSLRRADDLTADASAHPLLDYLGRDCRELQVRLTAVSSATLDHEHPLPTVSDHPQGRESATLLARLQAAVAANEPLPAPAARPILDPADTSIAVHAAHGPDRQVEVLRDVLVGLLADDETLEPRDIVVMCPDIETYAPLVSATFGLDAGDGLDVGHVAEHPGHRLRVRLADRSLYRLNPMLAALSRLLDLADSRVGASALLDLCLSAPVARKFGFGEEDGERITALVARSGVRWGLDGEHRAGFGLSGFGQNTWAAGLDRLLLGVAMDEDGQRFIGTALPLDDVDSADVDLVGRLAECVDRVRTAIATLRRPQSLSSWMAACTTGVSRLCAAAPTEAWQTSHAHSQLSGLVESAGSCADVELTLGEIRSMLARTFRGRASRANFRTGTLTMCTMLPMRSVPHRVVCLLGLDDGVFPRRTGVDGDDVTALDPWVGDRDPRSEDRQLLLDAIMAAEQRLVIVYSGADPRTGATNPPAVPLNELLEVIGGTVATVDGGPAAAAVTTRHPLQPFDPRNFDPRDSEPTIQSFDSSGLRGARASLRPRQPAPVVFGREPLPAVPSDDPVELTDLIRFYAHPVKALLRARAGVSIFDNDQLDDEIPVDLDGLQAWSIGDRLLRLHLRGADLQQLAQAEWRRGSLPPRMFGERQLLTVANQAREVADAARGHLVGVPTSTDVSVALPSRTVVGTISGLYDTTLLSVSFSRLSAKQRLQAWIGLLALTAGRPDRTWRAVVAGRRRTSTLGPVDGPWAASQLDTLVQTYVAGMTEPLPFSPKASAEYARIRYEGKSVQALAESIEQKWLEDRDLAYERFFGPNAALADLTAGATRPEEATSTLTAPTRFGTLALRVFEPMLSAEVLR